MKGASEQESALEPEASESSDSDFAMLPNRAARKRRQRFVLVSSSDGEEDDCDVSDAKLSSQRESSKTTHPRGLTKSGKRRSTKSGKRGASKSGNRA